MCAPNELVDSMADIRILELVDSAIRTRVFWEKGMRYIDLSTWPRQVQFEFFRNWDYPHFNMCANLDVTRLVPAVKDRNATFTVGLVYAITRVANGIPEFRLRIRGEKVVEHGIVHPSTTILTDNDLFSFCTMEYSQDFSIFAVEAQERIQLVKLHPEVKNEPGRDDLLYMTAIPWVSFTSFMHPIHLSPVDSMPRFAWGKFFTEESQIKMPLSVQAHHALMDGIHVGKFYQRIQEILSAPESVLA